MKMTEEQSIYECNGEDYHSCFVAWLADLKLSAMVAVMIMIIIILVLDYAVQYFCSAFSQMILPVGLISLMSQHSWQVSWWFSWAEEHHLGAIHMQQFTHSWQGDEANRLCHLASSKLVKVCHIQDSEKSKRPHPSKQTRLRSCSEF